jgi:DNA-directed RNA polymerase subunit K/omega
VARDQISREEAEAILENAPTPVDDKPQDKKVARALKNVNLGKGSKR